MRLNALVASPSFAAWGRGPALDPRVLLRTEEGKPRAAVVYLAHLSDEERQLVVTLVLSRLITWMHEQPGTSELRALVYLDEVFGFAPPTAAPPSKKPILTLHEAGARVRGRDGRRDPEPRRPRLQGDGERRQLVHRPAPDRERQGSACSKGCAPPPAASTSTKLDTAIGGLEQRQFLLQSAHRDEPVLFSTRWAMSFLRGPLTKEQIETLTPDEAKATTAAAAAEAAAPEASRADARRRRERRRARGRAGRDRPLSRPGRAVGRVGGRAARRQTPPGLPRRPCEPALRRHEGRARHEPGVGSALRPARRRPRPRRRDRRRLRRARLPLRTARRRELRALRPLRSTRSRSSGMRDPRDPAPGVRHPDARAPPLRRAPPLLAARRDERAVRGARGRGRAGGRGRRGGKDPRPARDEARPARAGSRGGAARESRRRTASRPRAGRPSSSPASEASSASSSAARRTHARSRAPAGRSAVRRHAAA